MVLQIFLIMPTFAAAFTATTFRITAVALGACGAAQGLCMAGPAATAAMVHTASALVGYTGMRASIDRRPIIDGMAGGAILSKHSCMEGRVIMAGYASGGQPYELA